MGYIIVDRNTYTDAYYVVNDKTTDIENIWYSMVPYNLSDDAQTPTPKIFTKKTEASIYLSRLRQRTRDEYEKSGHLNPIYNRKRTVFKIEKV